MGTSLPYYFCLEINVFVYFQLVHLEVYAIFYVFGVCLCGCHRGIVWL